jgi:uncharacterized protein YwqG
MSPDQIHQAFAPWRKLHERPAWRPITNPAQETNSWFGGTPSDSSSSDWPVCEQCQAPMQFFLQLDLAALPGEFETPLKNGFVQLFYCSTDDGMCETWDPFSGTHVIRLVSQSREIARPDSVPELERTSIVGWESFADYPHTEEHERFGISYDYNFKQKFVSVKCVDPLLAFEKLDIDLNVAEQISQAREKDKLGGWPFWVQRAEYPPCPECDAQMELLFQLDSNDNLDYMFGDVGCAHLTQCRMHPHVLAFGWACG